MVDLDPSIAWKAIIPMRERVEAMPDEDLVHSLVEASHFTGDGSNYEALGAKRFLDTQEFVDVLQDELKWRLRMMRAVADASVQETKAILDITARADAVIEDNNLSDVAMYVSSLTGKLKEAQEALAKATLAYMDKTA